MARRFWRDSARAHASRTLQRVPFGELQAMEKLGETKPSADEPASVLMVEDDDTSMFNKYKRTMLLMHFVNSDVDEMTADEMESAWTTLLNRDDVVSKSTFIKYKPFNIRQVFFPHILTTHNLTIIVAFSKRNFQSCVCPICREYFEAKKFCQSARSTLHRCCARCPTTEGCVQTTVGTASATRRATSNFRRTSNNVPRSIDSTRRPRCTNHIANSTSTKTNNIV